MGLGTEGSKREDRVPLRLCLLFAVVAILVTGATAVLVRYYIPRSEIQAGFSNEFLTHPYGYRLLIQNYGLRFRPDPEEMTGEARYKALSDGDVNIINSFSTDGHIPARNLVCVRQSRNP